MLGKCFVSAKNQSGTLIEKTSGRKVAECRKTKGGPFGLPSTFFASIKIGLVRDSNPRNQGSPYKGSF